MLARSFALCFATLPPILSLKTRLMVESVIAVANEREGLNR